MNLQKLSQEEINLRISDLLVQMVEQDKLTLILLKDIVKEIRTLQEKLGKLP